MRPHQLTTVGLVLGLAAMAHLCEAAVAREEIPACVGQVDARLADFVLHPTLQLVLERAFPDDGTDYDYDKEVDTTELSEYVCETHHERIYQTLAEPACHREFMASPFKDEYATYMLHEASRHTRFCILGVGVCEAHKRKLRTMHDRISDKFG